MIFMTRNLPRVLIGNVCKYCNEKIYYQFPQKTLLSLEIKDYLATLMQGYLNE